MAASSELAELYVSFAGKGSPQLDKQIDSKRARLMAAAGAALQFGKSIASASAAAIDRLGGVASKALAVGAALAGGLIAKGLGGTQEAKTLGDAFSLLGRAVADIAAPAIRALTQAIIEVSAWVIHMDAGTKNSILNWGLFAAGIAGFVATLPVLVSGIRLITSAVSAMMSKWVLIPAAILAVATAIIYLSGEGDTFEERMVSGVGNVAKAWVGFQAVVGGVWTFLKGVMPDLWALARGDVVALTNVSNIGDILKKSAEEADKAFEDIMQKQYFQTGKKASDMAQRIADVTKKIAGEVPNLPKLASEGIANTFGGANFAGMLGGAAGFLGTPMGRIALAFADKRPVQVEHKFNLQSLQSSWERLQTAMVGNDQDKQIEKLENIRRGIDKIERMMEGPGIKIKNPPPVVR